LRRSFVLRRKRVVSGSAAEHSPAPDVGRDFGWRVHEAIQGWTASVDVKASIVLVVETAVAGAGATALVTGKGELHSASGLHLACAIAAVACLVGAVGAALWVVTPRLARRRNMELAPSGAIYFGHLRHRTADEIESVLTSLSAREELHQLSRQLHVTSKVAWRKHVWLQASIGMFAIGALLLVIAFVAF
jgi:hypothetical protein